MGEGKTRESNLELLRLICMAFVVAGHLIIHGIHIDKYSVNEVLSGNIAYILIYSIFIIAVNCFVLISGYFSIKPSISGVTRLGLSVAFYGAAIYALFGFLGEATFDFKSIAKLFFPFSKSQYWFISAYFQLYLISPLLNKATESFGKHEFKIFIMLFSVITFYLGYLHGGGINPNGYNVVNFMYLYVIARY
ncbi:MAG: acyltransferase family protein, partial [Rikenellaceae bacterium]